MSWKQRVYAFLLRRVLGPYLTPDSLQKLHACLDVSLHEGTYVLTEIGLNAEYLSSKISGARLRSVTIRKLEIQLSLQDHAAGSSTPTTTTGPSAEPVAQHEPSEHVRDVADDGINTFTAGANDSSSGTSSSSLVWRAFQLGSSNTISLVVRIKIDGLLVEVEACPKDSDEQQLEVRHEQPSLQEDLSAHDETFPTASGTKGYLSSYLDAALASLRASGTLRPP